MPRKPRKKRRTGSDDRRHQAQEPRDVNRNPLLARLLVLSLAVLAFAGSITFFKHRDEQVGGVGGSLAEAKRPNVLLVVIDTLRADRLGVYGGPIPTPAIDRLARGGVVFQNAVSHVPITLPAHASIFTGTYPVDHGVRANALFRLDDSENTLAEAFARAGYRTAAFVGAFVLDSQFGLAQGFELYDDDYQRNVQEDFDTSQRQAGEVLERAASWIRDVKEEPWFVFVHLFDPHAPYSPPSPFRERYPDEPYLGEVAYVDDALGPFFDETMRAKGNSDGTLVVLTADHGEGLGEHGETTHGMFAYESTLRVPLIFNWPGLLPTNLVVPTRVRHVDIAPTVTELAGIRWDVPSRGESLVSRMRPPDEPTIPPEESYFEALSYHLERGFAPLQGIYVDSHKYIRLPIPELYDLTRDPEETRNVHAEAPDRSQHLANALRELAEDASSISMTAVDDSVRRRLQSLGYLGDIADTKSLRDYTAEDDPKRLIELNVRFDEAVAAQRTGRSAEAIRLFHHILIERPSYGSAYKYLAYTYRAVGDTNSAIQVLKDAIQRGVETATTSSQLASYLLEVGRPDEARAVLADSLATSPDHLESLQSMAVAQAQTGKLDDAVQTLEHALELSPRSASLLANLGALLFEAGQVQEAEAHLVRALDIDPTLASAWNVLGALQHAKSRSVEAVESWKRAVALDDAQFEALYNLAFTLAQMEQPDESRRYLERFLAKAPRERYEQDIEDARWLLDQLDRRRQ